MIDPLKINPNQLSDADLKVQFAILQERMKNAEQELKRLKQKPRGKAFLKMFVAVIVSLLMLLSGLLYTYAINKITAIPPDNGAESILVFAILIYAISVILQITNVGAS